MRRALLVGIDDYPNAPLAGCVRDALTLAELLSRHEDGAPNFDARVMTAGPERITRAILREAIEELFASPADVALFYFSGHGTENDLGGFLVTQDAARYDEGVSMGDVLALANKADRIGEVVIVVDSCHSGWLGTVPAVDNRGAVLREGISILTASRSSQVAMERGGVGVFTDLVCSALDGGAADILGEVSVAAVYAYVDQALGAWEQRPLFKSHVSRMLSLRTARPAVDIGILRKIPEWFPDPEADFPLSPRYEHTVEPADLEARKVFRCLQKCNRVKLVEPVDEEDMYYAAMNSTGCRLTALGRYYWKLANDGRI